MFLSTIISLVIHLAFHSTVKDSLMQKTILDDLDMKSQLVDIIIIQHHHLNYGKNIF